MATANISVFHAAVCAEYEIKVNPHVLDALEKTTDTESVTLQLRGNHRLRCVQRLDDRDVLALSKCLRNNECVTGLDVSYNNITDEGAGHLADLLQCNSTLLSLRLSGNKIGNRGAMHLASMLQVNDSLTELELDACDLVNTHKHTDTHCKSVSLTLPLCLQATQSVIAFAIALKSNKTLRSVDISRPLLFSHQEEWAVHFSEMLLLNSSLVELHLGKTGMTDTGMERLTEGLRLNRSLRYLDLRCNRVTRDGVRHLAETLKQNPTLEIIDLSANRIEDEGAAYLSEAVTWPGCVLRELSVSSNNIRTEGLLCLAQALTVNTTLNHIYIWGNHLEEPVCQAFRDLIASGRLPPEQTDVSAYEVDGHVFLAEVFHSLRRRYHSSSGTDTRNTTDTATDHADNPVSGSPPHDDESQQPVRPQAC
ncbi:Leucine-rich repeat-containing protein 34 [Nibea albiflora]|uniref:Leucine-rich repeat-containing protein 34 n=1 Tax=Nibea albiflora TaxID=240163 RepID=A0ACB7F6V2_NIBAL|nr:Leucine-rich repeat-containing protein 34 [Nibea albiflora]